MIDDHIHPFPLTFTPFEPHEIGLDVAAGPAAAERRRRLAPGRLYLQLLQAKLSGLLDVPHDQELALRRDELASRDWGAYVRRLFDDAGIAGMVLDDAVAPGGKAAPRAAYAELAGRPVWKLERLDHLVDQLIADGVPAGEIAERVERHMDDAAAAGCVAFKTILAYRTGLAVDPAVDLDAAQRSLQGEGPVRRRGKALRDLVFRRALGRAADLGLPVQIHTGFGDSELRIAESNPLLLEELLRTPEGEAATVVLIHGSFPWHDEAAYLATTKANVWVELSLSNLFAPLHTGERLLRMLDLAPAGRILLGSDGHGQPETHWFGCTVLRDAWEQVTRRLTAAGAAPEWIEETRLAVFEGNARSVYRLA